MVVVHTAIAIAIIILLIIKIKVDPTISLIIGRSISASRPVSASRRH